MDLSDCFGPFRNVTSSASPTFTRSTLMQGSQRIVEIALAFVDKPLGALIALVEKKANRKEALVDTAVRTKKKNINAR